MNLFWTEFFFRLYKIPVISFLGYGSKIKSNQIISTQWLCIFNYAISCQPIWIIKAFRLIVFFCFFLFLSSFFFFIIHYKKTCKNNFSIENKAISHLLKSCKKKKKNIILRVGKCKEKVKNSVEPIRVCQWGQ